jgi:hypothetical protein
MPAGSLLGSLDDDLALELGSVLRLPEVVEDCAMAEETRG